MSSAASRLKWAAIAVACLLACSQPAGAATYTWDVTTGDLAIADGPSVVNWETDIFWNDGLTPGRPWADGTAAVFGGGASGTGGVVAINGTVKPLSLRFEQPFGVSNYTLSGGTIEITGGGGITDNGTLGNTIVNSDVTGTASLNKMAGGTLTLSGTNAYTGPTTVNAGTLNFNSVHANGTLVVPSGSTATVNIGSGAKVAIADFSRTPATATVNATNPLAIASTLKLPGSVAAQATLTGGTSFTAAGTNLANASFPSTLTISGGTLTLAAGGGTVIGTFPATDTWVVPVGKTGLEYLVVGGGGGGGGQNGGGGGGGEFRTGFLTVTPGESFNITIGAGGGVNGVAPAYNNRGSNGGTSSLISGSNSVSAFGGGGGGGANFGLGLGGSGTGSAGGNGWNGYPPTILPGVAGGNGGSGGRYGGNDRDGGGGGGAGGNGGNGLNDQGGGFGGAGQSSSISGSLQWYAGGGGGAARTNAQSPGGIGGGGAGGYGWGSPVNYAQPGTPNTGGGGGGADDGPGIGGSGVVILANIGPINFPNMTIAVTANSTLNLSGAPSATFSALTIESGATLDFANAPSVAVTTVSGAGSLTVGGATPMALTANSIIANTLTIGANSSVTILPTATSGAASPVPEPGTWVLIGTALLGLLAFRRRR